MSIAKKRSKSNMLKALSLWAEPTLVGIYRHAVQYVCGVDFVSVKKSMYPKFTSLQHQLDNKGISYDRYAFTVVKQWNRWCKAARMKFVSAGIFCGEKAWRRFMDDLVSKPTVVLSMPTEDDWSECVHNELMAAQQFIMSDGAELLEYFREYPEPIVVDPNLNVIQEVLSILNLLYDCDAKDYYGIREWIK